MEIFLSEAVEASQCYFFEISFIKLKCPNQKKNVLLAFLKLEGQFKLAILDFKVCHFDLKHPVGQNNFGNKIPFPLYLVKSKRYKNSFASQ